MRDETDDIDEQLKQVSSTIQTSSSFEASLVEFILISAEFSKILLARVTTWSDSFDEVSCWFLVEFEIGSLSSLIIWEFPLATLSTSKLAVESFVLDRFIWDRAMSSLSSSDGSFCSSLLSSIDNLFLLGLFSL